jgi:hypothetical protein
MLLTHRSPLYALHLRASLVLGCLSLRHIISTDRFDQIFLTESRTLLASKRNNQCKPLAARKDVTINQLNQTIAQLNLSNQRKCSCQSTRGATPSPDSRARARRNDRVQSGYYQSNCQFSKQRALRPITCSKPRTQAFHGIETEKR